jgi:hypothetical protein
MDCEKLAPFYESYAEGKLEGEARAELEAHLARACPTCTRGVEKARGATPQHNQTPPVAAPPPVQVKNPLFPGWAWAAAVVLALVTGFAVRQMSIMTAQLTDLRKQMRVAEIQNESLQAQLELNREVAAVMIDPASKSLLLSAKDKNLPPVHAYVHPHMGVAFTADGLPPVPSSRTIQLWALPKKGMPVSVAIFHPDAEGQVVMLAPLRIASDEIASLEMTDEPAGGSPEPTTMPTWTAVLK